MANTIIDNGIQTVRPDSSFAQLNQGILDLAALNYDRGKKDGTADADKRVNKDSESYKQGVADSALKTYSAEIRLSYSGPNKEAQCFTSKPGKSENHKNWTFSKTFEGHTIIGVDAYEYSVSNYGANGGRQLALLTNGEYSIVSNDGGDHSNGNTIEVTTDTVTWANFTYNILYTMYTDIKLKILYI